MNRKIFMVTFGLLLMLFFGRDVYASHAAGGELTYEHLPNAPQANTYKFQFKFYRDCSGISWPTSVTMCYSNSCGISNGNLTLNMISPSPPPSVGTGCPGFPDKCTNPQSSTPGYQAIVYEATMVLPGIQNCNFWRFSVSISARNTMTYMGGGLFYVEATMNNATNNLVDNSPIFTQAPVPYCCVNQTLNFNNGVIDPDGDSLYIESVNPLDGPCGGPGTNVGVPAFPGPPYSFLTNPYPSNNSFVLNSATGALSITPTNTGTGVITVKVSSYRNGVLIGYVMRDIQIIVLNCTGQAPNPDTSLITPTIVNGSWDSSGIKMCVNDSLHFCFVVASVDTEAVVIATSNANISLPGGTVSYSYVNPPRTDSLQICIDWQTSLADTGMNVLLVTMKDSSCKPPGIIYSGTFTIPIFVDYVTEGHGDTIICQGTPVPLLATGGGPFSWSVLPGGAPLTSLSCVNCSNPTATPNITTSYVVEGCNMDTVVVQVVQTPIITISDDTTTCINSNYQLSATALPGNQTYTYQWSPANFLSSTTVPNPVVQFPNATTTYTVTVTPNGFTNCQSTAQVTINVLDGFTLDPHDSLLCDGESTDITGTGNSTYNYSWVPVGDPNPSNTLNTTITPPGPGSYTYSVTASYPGCPDSTLSVNLYVDPIPDVTAGIDREMCVNDTVHLTSSVLPDSAGFYTIEWFPGGDLDDPTVPDPFFDGKQNAILNVTYTTPNGCSDTDQLIVVVHSIDFLTLDGDREICPKETATLTAGGASTYLWIPDYYIDDPTKSTINVNPIVTTNYSVTGIDANGCKDTASAIVFVKPNSVVGILNGEEVTIYPGESIKLETNGNCKIFNWFPPSGLSNTTIPDPIAQPTATTMYYLNAETERGCPTMDSILVRVSDESILQLPNAFTPGPGTSINDQLHIKVRGVVTLNSFRIFNRWGEEVFSTVDINEGWDGQYKGKPQPLGAYVYVIDATTQSGKRIKKQGTITLIR